MRRTLIALGLLGLWPSLAQAYVLPADYLIKLLAEARRDQKIQDMTLHLQTERVEEGHTADVHLYLKQPARARRVEMNGTQRVYVERLGKHAKGTDGALKRGGGPLVDLTATLFTPGVENFDELAKRTLQILKGVGIDTSVTSFGRNGSEYVYIIGARSWETDKPQLWLAKSNYLPVRIMGVANDGGKKTKFDVHLLEYGSAVTGNWFPRVIEQYRDGKLVQRSEVTEIKLNQNLPESLFELP